MVYYVSVTGLELNSIFGYPQFIYHAIPSMMQAKGAPGNIFADAKKVGPIHHTLTVWKDIMAMRRYMMSGDHVKAMKSFHSFATGSTYGYEADEIPTWDEAVRLINEKGRVIGNKKSKQTDPSNTAAQATKSFRKAGVAGVLLVSVVVATAIFAKRNT